MILIHILAGGFELSCMQGLVLSKQGNVLRVRWDNGKVSHVEEKYAEPVTSKFFIDFTHSNGGISFWGLTPRETRMANKAICEVMERHGLKPFHQSGIDSETGYQLWEQWFLENKKEIEATFNLLIPKIERKFRLYMRNRDKYIRL